MSHISRKTARKSHSLKLFLYGCLFLCLFTAFDMLTNTAHAATATSSRKTSAHYILKSNLTALSSKKQAVLDWRTQSYELKFNLPAHDWYEDLDLFLSAYPEGNVGRNNPLLISYNGADPIALHGQGSRFDAHIRLDPSRIRAAGNSIKIIYKTPKSADCLTAKDGKWVLDLSHSKLVAKARPKRRKLHIAELEPRLRHPMTSPKRVAIVAKGKHAPALEAILAQGIAQRTHTAPHFQLTQTNADFTVLIGTHRQLQSLVHDKTMLRGDVPTLFIDTGSNTRSRLRLVLSAKNESQLTELARVFSTYHLPHKRKADTSLYELYSNAVLAPATVIRATHTQLSELGSTNIEPSWAPQAPKLHFNVENAHASTAQLTLHLAASKNTNPKSKVRVHLNDRSIGYTFLNKAKKKVAFDIPHGVLKATNNTLTITPTFAESSNANACMTHMTLPSILIGERSKLKLTGANDPGLTNLNRLTANGAPFVNTMADIETNTAIILTARSQKDRMATLQFLGFAARQFGSHWVGADYLTTLPQNGLDTNILIIGPNAVQAPDLIAAAPSALKLALGGKPATGTDTRKMAMLERHASRDEDQVFRRFAQSMNTSARINTGGIASLFRSPYANDKMIGIISATKPSYFATAMNSLSSQAYWNALQGSVSRWDKTAVLMAQTAAPKIKKHKAFGFDFSSLEQAGQTLKIWGTTNYKAKASNWIDVKFPAVQTSAHTISPQSSLRSMSKTMPVPTLKSTAIHKATQSRPTMSVPKTAGLKTTLVEWKSTILEGAHIPSMKPWTQKLMHNRSIILILIVLSVFFIAGSIPSRLKSTR